jgi:hypothetical protein
VLTEAIYSLRFDLSRRLDLDRGAGGGQVSRINDRSLRRGTKRRREEGKVLQEERGHAREP